MSIDDANSMLVVIAICVWAFCVARSRRRGFRVSRVNAAARLIGEAFANEPADASPERRGAARLIPFLTAVGIGAFAISNPLWTPRLPRGPSPQPVGEELGTTPRPPSMPSLSTAPSAPAPPVSTVPPALTPSQAENPPGADAVIAAVGPTQEDRIIDEKAAADRRAAASVRPTPTPTPILKTQPEVAPAAGCYVRTQYGALIEGRVTSNPYTGSETWTKRQIRDRMIIYSGPHSYALFVAGDQQSSGRRSENGLLEGPDKTYAGENEGMITFVRPRDDQGVRLQSPPLPASEVCAKGKRE
jgi:hypothetical protein